MDSYILSTVFTNPQFPRETRMAERKNNSWRVWLGWTIIAVVVSPVVMKLALPMAWGLRERVRRDQVKSNLNQIGLALHNYDNNGHLGQIGLALRDYEKEHQAFPPAAHPNTELTVEHRLSWLAELLPHLKHQDLYEQINFEKGWDDPANAAPLITRIESFNGILRDKAKSAYGTTDYVGLAGVGKESAALEVIDPRAGFFGWNRATRISDIKDGTSNTMAVAEAMNNLGPWGAAGSSTIRSLTAQPYINGPDGLGNPARYAQGMSVLFADGSVRLISKDTEPSVLEAISTINGGEQVATPRSLR